MKESVHPLEISLGMEYYATDTPGTGGRLRTHAEDFIVEEEPCEVGDEGPYLICRLTKKDWELQRAAKEISKVLGISHRRIGWTGTKDKHALTSQLISIYNATPEEVERVALKDLELEVVGRSNTGLSLGSHQANRFRITIRETTGEDLAGQAEEVAAICRVGIPNYFGIQRFGVIRPVTHLVGEYILRGDYEGAVCCYVGHAYPGEPEPTREARTAFLESRDAVQGLHELPVPLTYERSMLHHLAAHQGDYEGALRVLPPRLLSLFVSAFQSFLFNRIVSARMREERSLSFPSPGDRLVFEGGREDRVTAGNLRAAEAQLKRGRCRIAIFIPGSRVFEPGGPDDEVMASLLADYAITPEDFQRASDFVGVRYDGALRPASLSTDVRTDISGREIALSFSLPPGHYATTVCREFMKADPLQMI